MITNKYTCTTMQSSQFNHTIGSQTKAQGGNLPSGFCLTDISFPSTLFFIWRLDCADFVLKALLSNDCMNLATLDALHGKDLT